MNDPEQSQVEPGNNPRDVFNVSGDELPPQKSALEKSVKGRSKKKEAPRP